MVLILGFNWLAWLLIAAALAGGIYASCYERFWLQVSEVRIPLARLPRSFHGLRIALLSDTHLGLFFRPRHLFKVVDAINQNRPDLVCLAGDFVSSKNRRGMYCATIPILSRLEAPSGKFSVLGNHDYHSGAEAVTRVMRNSGFQVLLNGHAELHRGAESLFLIGLEDVLAGWPDVIKASRGIPDTACRIVMVHEPDYAEYLKNFPIDLQLSGHSHGGQVCLPLFGPIVTSRMGKKYHSGLHRADGLLIYTTRGVGTTLLPFRFFCRPEITIITLERG